MNKNYQIIKDFVEGKIDITQFEHFCKEDVQFRKSLKNYKNFVTENVPLITYIDTVDWSKLKYQSKIQFAFRWYLLDKKVKHDYVPVYSDKYVEELKLLPSWLPSSEFDWIEENILSHIPSGLNKTGRKKWVKEQVEALYPCIDTHPSWAQGTGNWPKDKHGNNLTFVKQKQDGEEVTYTFVDPNTNEEVEVVEFY